MKKILITGFLPYAGLATNPSEELLKAIKVKGTSTLLLPVSYGEAKKQLEAAIKKEKPDFILSFGLSPYRKEPTLEEFAYNEMKSIQPDETGVRQDGKEIIPDGEKSRHASLDVSHLCQVLMGESIDVSMSIDPGRFVCNMVYYLDLASGIPALFVHLPLLADLPLKDDVAAAEAIIAYINSSNK